MTPEAALEAELAGGAVVADAVEGDAAALLGAGLAEVGRSSTGGGVNTVDEHPAKTHTASPADARDSHEK